MDNPTQCKFVPDKNNIQLINLDAWIENSKWEMESKLDYTQQHKLYKFTCTKNRPPNSLFEVRMEMGSEVLCRLFDWKDIPVFEYESGLRLNILTDYFELYLPAYSSIGNEFNQRDYLSKIRFRISFDPKTLSTLISRRWF